MEGFKEEQDEVSGEALLREVDRKIELYRIAGDKKMLKGIVLAVIIATISIIFLFRWKDPSNIFTPYTFFLFGMYMLLMIKIGTVNERLDAIVELLKIHDDQNEKKRLENKRL